MASLAPPPNRHRASSTNVRPPLTLSSLGSRRRSNSLLDIPPPSPAFAPPLTPPSEVESPRTMGPMLTIPVPPAKEVQESRLESLVSRCLQLLHLTHEDTDLSTPSSPRHSRASTDSTILPLSASPTKETFAEAFPDDPTFQSRKWFLRGPPSVRRAPVSARVTSANAFSCSTSGAYARPLRAHALPSLRCPHRVLHLNAPHYYVLAPQPHRLGRSRPRTPRIHSKRTRSHGARLGRHFHNCGLEARVVNTRQCDLGEEFIAAGCRTRLLMPACGRTSSRAL